MKMLENGLDFLLNALNDEADPLGASIVFWAILI